MSMWGDIANLPDEDEDEFPEPETCEVCDANPVYMIRLCRKCYHDEYGR